MADVTVTIGAKDDGSFAATMQQIKSTAESEVELEQATERAGGSFERMAQRMAMRLVLLEAVRLAFEAIKNTVEAAAQKQFDVVQFQNLAGSVGNVNTELAETQRIAEATAQTYDQVHQARLKMYEAGVGFEQQTKALQIAGELDRIWSEDAGRLSEMEANIATGLASEEEMYHIATLLGGKYREHADAYRDMLRDAPLIERAMERQKVLADRQFEDQQRIGNIRTSFYEQQGVAEQIFRDKYRSVDPSYWNKDQAIAHAAYGAREGLQKKFAEGQRQMQKDLGVSDTTMTELINSGLVGSKELLEASREAEQERKRNADRGFQDQKAAIDLGKDETKLKLMQEERDALFDQVKAQQTLNDLTAKYNAEQRTLVGQAQSAGAGIKRAQEDSGKLADSAEDSAIGAKNFVDQINKAVPLLPKAPYGGLQPWEKPIETPKPGMIGSIERLEAHQRRIAERTDQQSQKQAGKDPASEATLKVVADLLESLPLLFTIGAIP